MQKSVDRDLENPETWDYERPVEKKAVKAPRVVVSVAFLSKDFVLVSDCAKRLGKKISEFIRDAARDTAMGEATGTLVFGSGSYGTLLLTDEIPPTTRVLAHPVEETECVGAVTY
jgi:hypothetical protein